MDHTNRKTLQLIARRAMIARGFAPDFPTALLDELKEINHPATYKPEKAKDLRDLQWCSVDNNDSLDLDQLSYAEQLTSWNTELAKYSTPLLVEPRPKEHGYDFFIHMLKGN